MGKKVITNYNLETINGRLPTLITKIPEHLSENKLCEYNFAMMKNQQDIPSYLQPIGHNKTVKQKLAKIKNFFQKFIRGANQHLTVNITENTEQRERLVEKIENKPSSGSGRELTDLILTNRSSCRSEAKDIFNNDRPRKLTQVLKTNKENSPLFMKILTPIGRKQRPSIFQQSSDLVNSKRFRELTTLSTFNPSRKTTELTKNY
jgi:hypothetical protein